MGIFDILGALAMVSGGVWALSEKLSTIYEKLDGRLDKIHDQISEGTANGRILERRVLTLEQQNDREITKLNHLLTQCRIVPNKEESDEA